MKYITFLLCSLLATLSAIGQTSGSGLIDGLYEFTLELENVEPNFLEGSIVYQGDSEPHDILAITRGDTLRCQEVDEYLNPLTTLFLIKKKGFYSGQWYDEVNHFALPVLYYPGQQKIELNLIAHRFEVNWNDPDDQIIFNIPLSPTVTLGKFISTEKQAVLPYSSNTSFDHSTYYAATGPIDLAHPQQGIEAIEMIPFTSVEKDFTLEALVPNFEQSFQDSLHAALIRWKHNLKNEKLLNSKSRFPNRYYVICDIDYWTEDWVSGSFELVGPAESVDGFTFIYDRNNNDFISFSRLVRSGDLSQIEETLDKGYLGLSFDYYGIIYKDAFNPINTRDNVHLPWSKTELRLKRKLNEIKK